MGREIKRVPLDFDWPMNERWPGYLVSFCAALDSDCDKCHKFAKIQGVGKRDYGCPAFVYLDPPTGKGYQLWETTSEGSPMSPVFAKPESLALWLVKNNASAFGSMTLPYEKWLAFIQKGGSAPSAVLDEKGLRSGVEFEAERKEVAE